jgi:hypothetical protein
VTAVSLKNLQTKLSDIVYLNRNLRFLSTTVSETLWNLKHNWHSVTILTELVLNKRMNVRVIMKSNLQAYYHNIAYDAQNLLTVVYLISIVANLKKT